MELITTKICMGLDIGVHGNLFGGKMMSFLDEAAAAYSCQICDTPRMITKKIEEVVFDIVVFSSAIYYQFHFSLFPFLLVITVLFRTF